MRKRTKLTKKGDASIYLRGHRAAVLGPARYGRLLRLDQAKQPSLASLKHQQPRFPSGYQSRCWKS